MLVNILKNLRTNIFVLIPVILVLIWSSVILSAALPQSPIAPTLVYQYLSTLFTHPILLGIIAVILLTIQAYCLVLLNDENRLIYQQTYIPPLIFTILISLFPSQIQISPLIFSNLFFILAINKIFNSFKKEHALDYFFEAGFLLSLASLFYFPFLFYTWVLLIALLTLRTFNWREWCLCLIGLMLPYVFLFTMLYISDIPVSKASSLLHLQLSSWGASIHFPRLTIWQIIPLLFLLFLSIVSIAGNLGNKSIKVSTRKFNQILYWILILSVILFFVFGSIHTEILYILSIPLSYFISNYLLIARSKRFVNILLFFLLIVYILEHLLWKNL